MGRFAKISRGPLSELKPSKPDMQNHRQGWVTKVKVDSSQAHLSIKGSIEGSQSVLYLKKYLRLSICTWRLPDKFDRGVNGQKYCISLL